MSDYAPLLRPPEWLDYSAFNNATMPTLDNRTAASLVLADLDYDAQLAAIHNALRGQQKADAALKREITKIEEFARRTSGIRNDYAVDAWVDRLHRSVFEDAARSMAAVGMLAPMVESVFYHAFQGIRRHAHEGLLLRLAKHARWSRATKGQWDCHYVWTDGRRSKNLVLGILQLADATGVITHLPPTLEVTLHALFQYRNKMFHNGFEWPMTERQQFATYITESRCPGHWFDSATSGSEPWVFYMSEVFIQHVVQLLDDIIDGIGAYCNDQYCHRPDSGARDDASEGT